jgi:hypothetical protein
VYNKKDKEGIREFRKLVNEFGTDKYLNSKKIIVKKNDNSYNIEQMTRNVIQEYKYTAMIQELISDVDKEKSIGRLNKNLFILNFIAPVVGGISILPILLSIYKKYGLDKICLGGLMLLIIIMIRSKKLFGSES